MKKLAISLSVAVIAAIAVMASDLTLRINYNGTTNETEGIVVYYGTSSRNYTSFQRFNVVTNAVLTNLPPNTSLYLSGRAIGYNGFESDLGNELFVTTAPITTNQLPSAVRDFRLSKIGNHIY